LFRGVVAASSAVEVADEAPLAVHDETADDGPQG